MDGEIEGRLRDVCLTVTGLPVDAPIVNNIQIDLPRDARAIYDEMEKEMFAEIEEFGVEAVNAAVKTMKLLQLFLLQRRGAPPPRPGSLPTSVPPARSPRRSRRPISSPSSRRPESKLHATSAIPPPKW